MKLMPKVSSKIEQTLPLKEYINKYGKMEIQFFQEEEGELSINLTETIEKYIKEFEINEITIHPPFKNHDIEYLVLRDSNYLKSLVLETIELSRKYNIHINLLFHTHWCLERLKYGITPYLKEVLPLIENENVLILLENLIFSDDRKICAVLEYAEFLNHPKLKVCIDVCHVHAKANLFKEDINEYLNHYLDKEKCQKYVYQIHFSYTADNDGYVKKSTHGIKHLNKEEVIKDINILREYEMIDRVIATEIGEEDYLSRKDQIAELIMLEELL